MDPAAIKRSIRAEKKAAISRLRGRCGVQAQGGARPLLKAVPQPEDLAKLRSAALQRRMKHEAEHMGNFERIYPPESSGAQQCYDTCLTAAHRCFEVHALKRMRDTLDDMASKQRANQVCALPPSAPALWSCLAALVCLTRADHVERWFRLQMRTMPATHTEDNRSSLGDVLCRVHESSPGLAAVHQEA